MKRLILALAVAILPFAATADDGLIRKESAHDVGTTIDRLESKLKERGVSVLARLDHAANAASVGLQMRPTELLLFGNPKLGTPLMQAAQTAAIDLPMKAVALRDDDGKVWLIYNDPAYLRARHGIEGADKPLESMALVLDKLTDYATTK